MKAFPLRAKIYIGLTALVGFAALGWILSAWSSADPIRFACYLILALVASGLKVNLPGIMATMSVNYLFVLLGIVELSLAETTVIGCSTALAQLVWKAKARPKAVQFVFNAASTAIAVFVAFTVYRSSADHLSRGYIPFLLALAASVYFLLNTVSVSAAIALTENRRLSKIWKECYFWSFAYYLVGAAITGVVHGFNSIFGWQATFVILPLMYWIYRSYRLYLGRLEAEKGHAEQVAALHLRTIEALALAIEAKDQTTHSHLRRVSIYALETAKELNLSPVEMDALRAAAMLHDIGKLAVPEQLISKPGRLTSEEFEKMKIHPIVGAEILERVQFPYPVSPIVRSHHEKWDGTGYPDGLKGEEIPVGARILSAVDCLDALSSDRPYRRALSRDQAMAMVSAEAGKSFDPEVVAILGRRYQEFEKLAESFGSAGPHLSTDLKIARGSSPAAGLEVSKGERPSTAAPPQEVAKLDFLSSIAAARQEAQMLFELSQSLGSSLSLDETLSVAALRLRRMIPFETVVVYTRKDDHLVPAYVSGEEFRAFSSLEVPLGDGLVGWVAQNHKPIVNGNPSVEPGYLSGPNSFGTLQSALAVPLEGVNGVVGVLALYRVDKQAFTSEHMRILLAASSKLGRAMENAMKYRMAEDSATTDYLTGLPNARSLFLQLDRELALCKRTKMPLALVVCDLNGFKQVNDHFGHLEGNKLLRAMGQALRESCREYDYVARMGGDEFVLVLPGMNATALQDKLLKISQAVAQVSLRICGEEIISLSFGEAFYPEDGTDAEKLLAVADRQMYVAKEWYHEQLGTSVRSSATHAPFATRPLRFSA